MLSGGEVASGGQVAWAHKVGAYLAKHIYTAGDLPKCILKSILRNASSSFVTDEAFRVVPFADHLEAIRRHRPQYMG